jgi:threonine-phosphate decarboxylase
MARAEHGDLDPAELRALGVDPAGVIDLSVNVSPFGPHPEVVRAVREASLERYPDRSAAAARAALALHQRVDARNVTVGNGAVELLWASVLACAREQPERRAPLLVVGPTFSEPEAAARAYGVPVAHVTARADDAFAIDAARIDDAVGQHAPCAVYLCHPNNPTGRALPAGVLSALFRAWPATTFLLDQSFLSLSTRHAEARLRFGDNVVLIRSLTKDHALAGLRAGYALCAPELAARIDAARPPWSISVPAQAAMIAAVEHGAHVARTREALLPTCAALAAGLAAIGCEVVPSETCFLLARSRAGDADAVRARLLQRHAIAVRSARSFGLPEHIRIAAPTPANLPRVLAALVAAL